MLDTLVSLSIVSHGHGDLVSALLNQLDDDPHLSGVTVILTLNKQGEQVDFHADKAKNIRLIVVRNELPCGFGANHNKAFSLITTPWFCVLNPDLVVRPGVFLDLITCATELSVSLLAPAVFNSDGEIEDSVRENLTPWSIIKRRLLRAYSIDHRPGRFKWFAGMFLVIKSADFDDIGGFDERYFLYCEDYDLCARLFLAGRKLYFCEGVSVVHDAQRRTWKSPRYLSMHLRSIFRVWFSRPVWLVGLRQLLG